jgi:hypothetical protein
MKILLKKNGWQQTTVVGGKFATRQQLKEVLSVTDEEINQRLATLKGDIQSKRLPSLGADGVTAAQRQLYDEKEDLFVIIFDGQHRSESQTDCLRLLFPILSCSIVFSLSFH